ncbi:MAG: energy transducer TonB [Paludibacter sp.]|nr:energy transducer TonB [Paludibacter sp.]
MNYTPTSNINVFKFSIALLLLFTFSFTAKAQNQVVTPPTQDSVYSIVDSMPKFPGGDKALLNYIYRNTKYPTEAYKKKQEGKVIVQFVINKLGLVENAKVARNVSPLLDKEALRVVNSFPAWIPGIQNELNVAVNMTLPIIFKYVPIDSTNWDINEKTLVIIDDVKMPENFTIDILNLGKFTDIKVFKPFPEQEKERLMKEYGKQAADGVVLIKSNKYDMYYALADSTGCKEAAAIPKFEGGNDMLMKHIADSIQYPFVPKRLKTEGKVMVRFTVEKTGKINDVKVVKSLDYYLDKEAIRVINTLPNWIPGTQCNQKVNIIVTMPVNFTLDVPATEKAAWKPNEKTVVMLDGVRLPSVFDLEWLSYANLTSYKVLEPKTKEVIKQLTKEYGKDAVNGVVLIRTKDEKETK